MTAGTGAFSGYSDTPAKVSNGLFGGDGNDQMSATGTGQSNLAGSGGDVTNALDGGNGNDSLLANIETFAGFGRNDLFGGGGDDRLEATAAATRSADSINHLEGGGGDDILIGKILSDPSPEAGGRSELFGGANDDTLTVFSGAGNILDGGRGDDRLNYGDGSDVCVFRQNYGDDSIGGFDASEDKIRLLGFGSAKNWYRSIPETGDWDGCLGKGKGRTGWPTARRRPEPRVRSS
jgi:Ca2+-binding RTX toxin-like protein